MPVLASPLPHPCAGLGFVYLTTSSCRSPRRRELDMLIVAHRNAVCVSGSKIHRVAGNAPINPVFFAMRASCHIGGWPGADVHSDMRVNGFLYAQSVVMWIQHQHRRVVWLGAGDSPPFGSRTKCSCPAEARSASKCENKLWNRGFYV